MIDYQKLIKEMLRLAQHADNPETLVEEYRRLRDEDLGYEDQMCEELIFEDPRHRTELYMMAVMAMFSYQLTEQKDSE